MDLTALASAALLIVALALLAIALWNVVAWPSVAGDAPPVAAAAAVLIPARDEERNLPDCLEAAIAQDSTVGEILVYDDHSTDATARIVREFAARDRRVRLVTSRTLPQGWCGKTFGCATLAAESTMPWLVFLDADARLQPGAVRRMLGEALGRGVSLLSPWPRLVAVSAGERALMPLLDVVVFTLFPAPLSLRRPDPSLGLVHGACILAERRAYDRVGGHGAVRSEIFEDQRLARLWRDRGERGLCLGGRDVVSVRMYRSVGELWRGFQKNFYPAFRHAANFWAFLILHGVVLVAPFILLAIAPQPLVIAAALAIVAMRSALAVRFGHGIWSVVLHPFAGLFVLAIGISSWWRCRSGRGVEWKGRVYRTTNDEAAVAAGGFE